MFSEEFHIQEKPSILISDDNQSYREAVCSLFEAWNVKTCIATCGEEALEIVQHEPIHLMITDLHMPDFTGIEIINQVREWEHDFPSILVSADVEPEIISFASDLDIVSVIRKPFKGRDLSSLVENTLVSRYQWKAG